MTIFANRATLLSFLLLLVAAASHPVEIYHRESEPGIYSFESEYGIHRSWHVRCVEQTSGRGQGSRRCELEPTDGTRYPRTGIARTSDVGPRIEIWHPADRPPHVEVSFNRRVHQDSVMSLRVGEQRFQRRAGAPGAHKNWEGQDAAAIVRAFIEGSTVRHDYIDGARKRQVENTSLLVSRRSGNTPLSLCVTTLSVQRVSDLEPLSGNRSS